jgi:PilZ domain
MEARGLRSGDEISVRGGTPAAVKIEPRRPMWAVAEVSWADPAGRPVRVRATIVDISTSGACIRLKHQIDVGSRLTIKWHREQFAAIARNCRADGADYLLGVRRDNSSLVDPRPTNPAPERSAAPLPVRQFRPRTSP